MDALEVFKVAVDEARASRKARDESGGGLAANVTVGMADLVHAVRSARDRFMPGFHLKGGGQPPDSTGKAVVWLELTVSKHWVVRVAHNIDPDHPRYAVDLTQRSLAPPAPDWKYATWEEAFRVWSEVVAPFVAATES